MNPAVSLENFTPTSIAWASPLSGTSGVFAAGFHRLEHGQTVPVTFTSTPAPGISTLPLSSIARLNSETTPLVVGDQSYVHVVRPRATCHVAPPSTDTSTAA